MYKDWYDVPKRRYSTTNRHATKRTKTWTTPCRKPENSHRIIYYQRPRLLLDWIWNVVAHAQKPYFVFRRNGRVHLNRQGASVQSTTGSRVVCIGGSNAGYTMYRGSVKVTGYPLHSPVSPSLPLLCVTVCHHISTGLCCCYAVCVTALAGR